MRVSKKIIGIAKNKNNVLCISQFQQPPPPRATAGHLPVLSAPGVGHLQSLRCPGDGHLPTPGPFLSFDTHAASYQNMTTQRILLGKKGDWLICQGQEKIEEGCKGTFLDFMHAFLYCFILFFFWGGKKNRLIAGYIAYQARIT